MKDKGEGDGGLIAHGQMICDLAMKDWLLLENQIPFFVVKKVFQLFITRIYVVDHSLEELAINALEGNWYMGKRDSLPTVPNVGEEVHHLLHLFYLTILPPVTQPGRSEEYSSKNPIMAFKLKKKVNNVVHKLHCCHLLPPFRRQGTSLEGQDNTPPPPPEWFPSATSLKESWVKLKEEEIILNHLGSEKEAARLFNKLAMEVAGDMTKNHLLDEENEQVEGYVRAYIF
ncbi:hypothetical protein QJS10_CPB04g00986 [Acorus calamus]|uniref:Uncharacterized protein n=1 Tax=Acorus calamus TaxID=4465 RepID=A0AAV9F112_ACOCL|nr:hypothetical protein QJS10_CPB04g00986 [Acorus calamus]